MRKTNEAKRVNSIAKDLNRQLEQDVFGNRFWVRQYQKSKADGIDYFLYELIDRIEPERNHLIRGWINVYDAKRRLWEEMNDFIVRSDFWSIYHNKPENYSIDNDPYKKYPEKY